MPNENDSNAPRPVPPTPLQSALPDDGKRKADDAKNEADELAREFRTAEKWVIGTNVTLAIVGIVALCIYYGQLTVMRGQLGEIIKQFPEIQKSTNAAKDAATAATRSTETQTKAFHADLRAWLVTDFQVGDTNPVMNEQLVEPFTISITGKTPAHKIHGAIFLEIIDNDKSPNFRSKEYVLDPPRAHPSGPSDNPIGTWFDIGILFPNAVRRFPARGEIAIPSKFVKYPERSYIALYGSINYFDVFDHSHWIYFCSTRPIISSATSLNDPRRKCIDYNNVDPDVE